MVSFDSSNVSGRNDINQAKWLKTNNPQKYRYNNQQITSGMKLFSCVWNRLRRLSMCVRQPLKLCIQRREINDRREKDCGVGICGCSPSIRLTDPRHASYIFLLLLLLLLSLQLWAAGRVRECVLVSARLVIIFQIDFFFTRRPGTSIKPPI